MARVLTYSTLAADTKARLSEKYPIGEAKALARIIFERIKGYSPTDMIIKGDNHVSDFIADRVNDTVRRLIDNEPIQYIFGIADFYGLEFKVSPAVLIPRPETAELVDIIVTDYRGKRDLSVIDICTGSGCIACALARNLLFPDIIATDISTSALDIASTNAKLLKVNINFIQNDLLTSPLPDNHFDIIVSNPPYILDHERNEMEPNVLLHEPQIALFVPDTDPLKFYRPIIQYSAAALTDSGILYLEINPLQVSNLKQLLADNGFTLVEIIRDTHGRQRFIKASLQ